MVSSSLDKIEKIKKALEKDTSNPSDSCNADRNNSFQNFNNSENNLKRDQIPPNEKIQLMFPKCKPRNDYQCKASSTPPPQDIATSTKLISIAPSSIQSVELINTQANSSVNDFNMNNRILMKLSPVSPDHKIQQHPHKKKSNSKHEQNDNYVETNPFRIGRNNQYFYAPNDSIYDNNNSALAASNNRNTMDQHNYPLSAHHSYHASLEDPKYFLEPDEIEHNPYILVVDSTENPHNTIRSSILKSPSPASPPALTITPRTTPVDTSSLESNRNIWDLSPVKINTSSRIKTQSPTPTSFTKSNKGSFKKLLASPVPIEEDLETGHFYYNNQKPYYQALQTDSDSNEPATIHDVQEVKNAKLKSLLNKTKMKHSESNDFIYADVKKKEERKIVKSKSGSGIMGKVEYIFRRFFQMKQFCFRI